MRSMTTHNPKTTATRGEAGKAATLIAALAVMVTAMATEVAFAAAITTVDVVVVIDESESMLNSDFNRIGNAIQALDEALVVAGATGNRYALIKFGAITEVYGGSASNAIHHQVQSVGGSTFGTATQLDSALGAPKLGTQEDGYLGVVTATTLFDRAGAGKIVILITDEARVPLKEQGMDSKLTKSQTLAALTGTGAILNVIVDNALFDSESGAAIAVTADATAYMHDGLGGFSTEANGTAASGSVKSDYIDLAWASGGAAFDLFALRATKDSSVIDSLIASLIEVKLIELGLIGSPGPGPIPSPASGMTLMALIGLGVLGRRPHHKPSNKPVVGDAGSNVTDRQTPYRRV